MNKYRIFIPRYKESELSAARKVRAFIVVLLMFSSFATAFNSPFTSLSITAILLWNTIENYLDPVEVEIEGEEAKHE